MLFPLQRVVCLLGFFPACQISLRSGSMDDWTLELSNEWDVLGPFPISAREQHFLSPSFPLDLSSPYPDPRRDDRSWPSAYADGSEVRWSTVNATENGSISISYPEIRWSNLRATEGWAALQHHTVSRTRLKVTPPSHGKFALHRPRLSFSVTRASFFTLIPTSLPLNDTYSPEWHPGNIYELPRSPKQLVELPFLSLNEPTVYDLFVSGDYEIRLFGDPQVSGHQEPILDISINIRLETQNAPVELDPALDVTCDIVDGLAFGTALGVGLRATAGWWDVLDVSTSQGLPISLSLLHGQRLAPMQSRIVAVQLTQNATGIFKDDSLDLSIKLFNAADSRYLVLAASLKFRHRPLWNSGTYDALRATYFLAGVPTLYLVLPPLERNVASSHPPMLALHGAGVDMIESPFWPASLPRQRHSWIILPAGRTSWGFDWHGPSADDVWGSLAALTELLASHTNWTPWTISKDTKVVVIGHSNGGQGTWYTAARYPDLVIAAIPAAAYIKAQQYIPTSLSRGYHFVDPSLRAVLDAAVAPDDNDLFLSNVVDVKILAIHGGKDENVPTWHSRESVGLVRAWKETADVSFLEEAGKPHWYPEVFASSHVQSFLSSVLEDKAARNSAAEGSYTLTVATPRDSGSLHGMRIEELEIPGRLGRLHITEAAGLTSIRTTNVHVFSIDRDLRFKPFSVDGMSLLSLQEMSSKIYLQRSGNSWKASTELPRIRLAGPLSQIMRSVSPLYIVIPAEDRHALSIATRIAHAMLQFFRIDTEIVTDVEALNKDDSDLAARDLIIVSDNAFGREVLRKEPGLVVPVKNGFSVRGKKFDEASLGLLFRHLNPFSANKSVLFLWGTDNSGKERAARLILPFRTGVTLPEFIILGADSDASGIGGLLGAGFWDRAWGWSESMAWLK